MRGSFTYPSAIAILLLSIFTYLYALDSRFAPKNGDEYPYMHIVRMTAESGAWLPLQSEMDGIKNTKPPLLFWEGIASTSWGAAWSLFVLRWPSLVYTGLTVFFLFLAVARFSDNRKTGLLAALVWLSFFATYRYGRPFLTDPPEVFWMTLPFFALLYWGKEAFNSKFLFPGLAGLSIGMALLAKSFAYVVPACFALTLFYWRWQAWNIPQFLIRDAYKVLAVGLLALGVFSLWFVLDPFPQEIWKEFVVGENAGKFDARSTHYLQDLVRGGDSIWMLIITTLANAGLFTLVLISALIQCWRQRRFLSLEESLLLLLVLAFFIVFSLPSQRSGRYLLPVMPAFAALIALYWDRLPLWSFRFALLLQFIVLAALTWVGSNLQLSDFLGQPGLWAYSNAHWVLMGSSLILVSIGILKSAHTKTIALAGCFLCYVALNSSLSPLEGSLGRYDQPSVQALQDQDIWIPCDYRAKDEEYRLLLPRSKLHGYAAKDAGEIEMLTNRFPLVAVQSPIGVEPSLCDSCKILGKRMEMRARHSEAEIKAILMGQIGEYLFVNEYLISTPATLTLPPEGKDACR